MSNKEIANQFSLLSKLMDIHGENGFKSKTYSVVAYKISQLTVDLQTLSAEKISRINGIGEAISKKIVEIVSTGRMKILDNLIEKTPVGIFEMLKIKGLGPKKIAVIWKEMGIENIGELLYACNENHLLLYPGFGKKTQENVIESIEFYLSQQDSYLYAQVEELAIKLKVYFKDLFNAEEIKITGDFARQSETVDALEYVIPLPAKIISDKIDSLELFEEMEKTEAYFTYRYNQGICIKIYPTTNVDLIKKTFETTGSTEFVSAFEKNYETVNFAEAETEKDIFKQASIQYVPGFLREDKSILSVAKEHKIPQVIQPSDIQGIIHCHSKWSDGINTIEELAAACIKRGIQFLVMSDHSKTANYANGLTEDRLKQQHLLIDSLNQKLAPFKIFKSIESDILNDGNLDYPDSILSTFDLVIASVHSNLKMNEEKAMSRLLRAIENPFTTILGHMTGRLLLSRKGYPLDYKKIIDACAANNVVIEINAHPRRLDMRWQWIDHALSKSVLLSINPDAHSVAEFENIKYGVLVAQKAMVTAKNNLSSFSLAEFEKFIGKRRK